MKTILGPRPQLQPESSTKSQPPSSSATRRTAGHGAAALVGIGLIVATLTYYSQRTDPVAVAAPDITQAPSSVTPESVVVALESGVAVPAAATASRITELEAAAQASPSDGSVWQLLSAAYLRRAFETTDPSYYSLARNALDRSEAILGDTVELHVLRADLLLALHDFNGAKSEAEAALAIDPEKFDAQIALTDAAIETGDYDRARDLVDTVVTVRPGVASFSRLSYFRQLTGDIVGAEAAMRSAVSAAPAGSVDRGVALAYLGDIQLERGALGPAERSFDQALQLNPASSVAAIGKAQVQAVRQELAAAAQTLDDLAERTPTPSAFGLRADVARATGDTAGAVSADQLVDASIALLQSNGAVVDAELALLLADRGPTSAAVALGAATQAYNAHKTVFTNDAMAWALAQSGRPAEAQPYIEAALATNPQVAMIHWHAAVIYDSVANPEPAKAALTEAMKNRAFSPTQAKAMRSMAQRYGVDLVR